MIRAMTIPEIQKALRHGAQVCIERNTRFWAGLAVLSQDGAFHAACDFVNDGEEDDAESPEHAGRFLLLVAEALA